MRVKIHLSCPTLSGSRIADLEGELKVSDNFNPHDVAATLFACEFAINNHASAYRGTPVRAHISLTEDE